jgi:hypothetical protein
VRDHSLAIGALRTVCTALVWPGEQPALRGMLDRVTGTSLPAALSQELDPVLDGLDGVVRIRCLQLDVDYLGQFDEAALAHALAMRIVAALRDALRMGKSDVLRHWPDQAAYLAAYIERRLALTLNPAPLWAFEGFGTLDHLPPERAAAEMLCKSPEILISLAQNAAAETDPARFARALDEPSTRALIDALLDPASPQTVPNALAAAFRLMDTKLRQLAITEPARAALSLTLILLAGTGKPHIREALGAATLVTALLHLRSSRDAQGDRFRLTDTSTAALAETAHNLSPTVITLVRQHLGEPAFRQCMEDIMPDDLPAAPPDVLADSVVVEATPDHLYSPIAGIGLLLPVIADLCLPEYLVPRHLFDAVLSILGPDEQAHAVHDPLFASIFPFDRHDPDQPAPPVPEALKTRLAPETLPLLTGDGANAWGDLTLAAFASRLPGLKASSRGYLQAQFLHTPGRLTFGEESLGLTLQGPDLAIILKMAGFSGVQRKLPHLDNRLLIINLAGLVP